MASFNDQFVSRESSIPRFNQHGTALIQDKREAIAKKKGVCVGCSMKTHDVGLFNRNPLNTDRVHNGTCISFNNKTVPPPVFQQWERKFKPQVVKGRQCRSKEKMAVDTIRCLAMDAVQKANSGHPGFP